MTHTVLITGASAGIGAALARTYAARGWNLILTARREGPLQALADELTAAHPVTATVISEDLSDPAAPERLVAAIAARGLTVDGLVNNAGFSRVTGFLATDLTAHRAMIQVMLSAPIALSRLLLPGMVERGFGRVLNVASLAGQMPATGGDTLYGRYWGGATLPGLHFEACYYQGIEYCLREGLARFEPGAQGEHKLARGFLPTRVRSRHWVADAEFAGALQDWCRQERRDVRRYQQELQGHGPFRVES